MPTEDLNLAKRLDRKKVVKTACRLYLGHMQPTFYTSCVQCPQAHGQCPWTKKFLLNKKLYAVRHRTNKLNLSPKLRSKANVAIESWSMSDQCQCHCPLPTVHSGRFASANRGVAQMR